MIPTRIHIIRTTDDCRIELHGACDVVVGLPQLVCSARGFLVEPNRWLMMRRLEQDAAFGTVENEAVALRSFLHYLAQIGREWNEVDDGILRAWRSNLRMRSATAPPGRKLGAHAHGKRNGLSSNNYVNTCLSSVFNFYLWCQQTGRADRVVNITGNVPADGLGLSCKKSARTNRNGSHSEIFRTTLVLSKSPAITRPTPTDDEIARLHQHARGRHAERNALIASLAEETGARRNDTLQVRMDQVPDVFAIEAATQNEQLIPLKVTGKNGIVRVLNLRPDLALGLRLWADVCRAEIVRRAKSRSRSYREPRELFISDRGHPLSPTWLSNIVTDMFRAAGGDGLTLHRLRAAFLTRVTERFVSLHGEDGEGLPLATMQFFVKELAGWNTLSALDRYVVAAYRRKAALSGSKKLEIISPAERRD